MLDAVVGDNSVGWTVERPSARLGAAGCPAEDVHRGRVGRGVGHGRVVGASSAKFLVNRPGGQPGHEQQLGHIAEVAVVEREEVPDGSFECSVAWPSVRLIGWVMAGLACRGPGIRA